MPLESICACVYLFLYFIRPHEWLALVEILKPVQLTTIISGIAIFNRNSGFRRSMFVQTPHDKVILVFFLYIIFTADDWWGTFNRLKPVLLFYFVIVLALRNWDLLEKYLTWWVIVLLMTCTLALLQLVGFDPMGSLYWTQGYMKGRMVLNNSILSNPNALGHTVVPAIPLVYYLWIWKRPIFVKIPSFFFLLLPAFTVFNTQSKGSYLAGSATLLLGGLYKRHWVLQLAVIFFVSGAGIYLIKKLPRMDEFEKDEGGIQGRETAFSYGYYIITEKAPWTGVGYKNYASSMQADLGFFIATHGSYNEVGSTLGRIGMYLYLGIIYLNLRVLIFANTRTVQQERIMRLMIILVISFCISACVIDWAFNATFFYLAAICSVFFRLSREQEIDIEYERLESNEESAANIEDTDKSTYQDIALGYPTETKESDEPTFQLPFWTRIRWFDYLIVVLLVAGLLRLWKYAIEVEF